MVIESDLFFWTEDRLKVLFDTVVFKFCATFTPITVPINY